MGRKLMIVFLLIIEINPDASQYFCMRHEPWPLIRISPRAAGNSSAQHRRGPRCHRSLSHFESLHLWWGCPWRTVTKPCRTDRSKHRPTIRYRECCRRIRRIDQTWRRPPEHPRKRASRQPLTPTFASSSPPRVLEHKN